MILKQYRGPTAEPIHLTEAKLHLRAGGSVSEAAAALYTAENSIIAAAVSGARYAAETAQWRALVLQTWDLYLDSFPAGKSVELPLPPLRAVEFFRYTNSSGVTANVTNWSVDPASEPGRIVLNYGQVWPSVTLAPKTPIQIRFQCGYLVPFARSSSTVSIPNSPLAVGDRVRLSVSGGTLPAPLAVATDYYVTATGLSLTEGGADVVITATETGNCFIGELPECTNIGMKLILTDLYENRGDTVGKANTTLPRGAAHWFAMDTARRF